MKKLMIYLMAMPMIMIGLSTSCINELDNYDAPDGGIHGSIIDEETGEVIPLPVQGSTGLMISLMEVGTNATKPVDFYAQYDGTYELSKVFNCDYEITINNGPFVGIPTATTKVNGQTKCDIKATPLSRITANATVNGKVITINYKVTPTGSNVVSDVYGYWNFAPGVDDGNANKAGTVSGKNLTGSFTIDLANNSVYNANIHKINSNKNTIYVRVGAKSNSKINYSVIIPLTVN